MRIPKPEVTTALLDSDGLVGRHRPALSIHHYAETRPATLPTGQPIWEHLFKCSRTGVLRRWGYEAREDVVN